MINKQVYSIKGNKQINLSDQLKSVRFISNEKEKLRQVKLFHNQIKSIHEYQLFTVVNIEFFKELLNQISDGRSNVSQELIEVVRYISEFGSDQAKQHETNIFLNILQNSQLSIQIENIIEQNSNKKNKYKSGTFPTFITHLIQTFSFINKFNYINRQKILAFTGKVIKSQIITIQTKIIEYQKMQQMNNVPQKQCLIDQIENLMLEGITTLKSFTNIIENTLNRHNLLISFNFYEIIFPLFHINCLSSLKCQKCISSPETLSLQDFKAAILRTITCLLTNDISAKNILNDQILFQHIIPIIIQFIQTQNNQVQLQNQSNSLYQNQTSSLTKNHSISLLAESLNLLNYLLNSNACYIQMLIQTPELIPNIFNLINFQQNNNKFNLIYKYSTLLRTTINNFIQIIIKFSQSSCIHQMIIDWRLIQIEVNQISSTRGNQENNEVVRIVLINIRKLFSYIFSQTSQIDLQFCCLKDLEENGGIEEIESHIYHSASLKDDDVCYQSIKTKDRIFNIKKDELIDDDYYMQN